MRTEAVRGEADDGEDHVFTHGVYPSMSVRYGVPARPDWVTRRFRQVAKAAELPPLYLYGLRTTPRPRRRT